MGLSSGLYVVKGCSNSMIGCVNKLILFKGWEEQNDANVVTGEEEKSRILASRVCVAGRYVVTCTL